MKAAFTKISVKGVFEPRYEFGTDLYGRFIYLEGNGEKALICVFDFLGTYPADALRFRREMSEKTGIPEKAIWYHELQIHAAPENDELHGEHMTLLIERSAEAVLAAVKNAEECQCSAVDADFGTDCTFCREQYVEGLGGVTVWSGMSFDTDGRPYSQNPGIMLLRGYKPELPVFAKPIYFDNPNDPKAYLFVFRNMSGQVIGTVSRFAAHPDVAVLFELRGLPDSVRLAEYHYDHDWPGYMSELLEERFGGTSVYLNGPCADLSTKKGFDGVDSYEASAAECKRLAKWFGHRLADEFAKSSHPVDTDSVFRADTFEIEVPINDDIPHDEAELADRQTAVDAAEIALRDAVAAGESPARIKRLIDDRWRASYIPHVTNNLLHSQSPECLGTRVLKLNIAALRFGGYLFVGVPGESMTDTAEWLRSCFTGAKTIPVDQVDGYYNYMATPRSLTLGGYTYWCSWVSRETVPTLKRKLYPLLEEFMR